MGQYSTVVCRRALGCEWGGGVTERFMAVRRAAWASCVRASRESTGISAIAWLGLGLGLGIRVGVRVGLGFGLRFGFGSVSVSGLGSN